MKTYDGPIKDWRPHGPERGAQSYGPNEKLDAVVAISIGHVRILDWLHRDKRRSFYFHRMYVYIQQDGIINVLDPNTGELYTTTFPIMACETTLN